MTKPLLIEHDDGTDRVTLNRSEGLKAFDAGSSEGIRAFLEKRKPVYIKR